MHILKHVHCTVWPQIYIEELNIIIGKDATIANVRWFYIFNLHHPHTNIKSDQHSFLGIVRIHQGNQILLPTQGGSPVCSPFLGVLADYLTSFKKINRSMQRYNI